MAPEEAMFEIQELMDGVEWTPQTLNRIAEILTESGWPVRDIGEMKPYQEGQWFIMNAPGYDSDPERLEEGLDEGRFTPIGSLVVIDQTFKGEDKYSVHCPQSGGRFFMAAEGIRTLMLPPPRIFDALPEDDHNSFMDRYTVITGMENGRYHFLGCSIGGRAFSQWGEIRQGDIEGDLTNLGREITMQQLDQDTRNHIVSRINE